MTDKQIIIDGVNVAKCVHLYREIDCLAHMDYSECCEGYDPSYGYCPNTDCYYKQLRRKEQECEMLKLSEKSLTETIENIARGFEELKAENEQLKNFHINLVGVKECEIKELAELKTDNKHLNDLLNQALKELEEYREAIKKVKEIANSIINDDVSLANLFSFIVQIDNICDEVNDVY